MLGTLWTPSRAAAHELSVSEFQLSFLRENGFFKPGIHWKSSPNGQLKPWNPEALYNVKLCRIVINKRNIFNEPEQRVA